jgi:RND family efflux transporter MFP subunit
VVSIDPIWIYFDMDEPSLLRVREAAMRRTGRVAAPENVASLDIPLQFGLVNEVGYPHTARLDFVDNRVDPATGTMRVRAIVRNPDRKFSPGYFVRVKLPVGEPHAAVLVAERAIGTDQDRKYLLVVTDQNVVEYRPVKLGPAMAGLRVIDEGLRPGEWVVVNGLQRVRPGVTVTPQRVEMQADVVPAGAPASAKSS